MECLNPITIRKEGVQYHVPCSSCEFCLQRRRADWTFRLLAEQRESMSSYFVTLTYAEEFIKLSPSGQATCSKDDFQKFMKRLRKYQEKETKDKKWKIKYYGVQEYGGKFGRPHYHIILFNATKKTIEDLHEIWYDRDSKVSLGRIDVGTVTNASIHYVTGYVINDHDKEDDREEPRSFMSKKLGYGYYERNWKYHKQLDDEGIGVFTVMNNGRKQYIPRYYKDKLFGIKQKEMQRERIIKNLDKEQMDQISRSKNGSTDYFEKSAKNIEEGKRAIQRRSKTVGKKRKPYNPTKNNDLNINNKFI